MVAFNQVARTTAEYQKFLFLPEAQPALKYRGGRSNLPVAPSENIIGLCTQRKYVEGKPTDEPAITFIVKKKKSPSRLAHSQEFIIPAELPIYDEKKKKFLPEKKFRTDVEECKNILLAKAPVNGNAIYANRARPVPGGYSVGNARKKSAGTLGFWVELVGKGIVGISNYHVLALPPAREGDLVVQPGRFDNEDTRDNVIGSLLEFAQYVDDENRVDLACFTPNDLGVVTKNRIEVIGQYKGFTKPVVGMKIAKVGRTTGCTEGVIQAVDATIKVRVGRRFVLFGRQIKTDCRLDSGDSGSALIEKNSKSICGLCFATYDNGMSSFANNIQYIFGRHSILGWKIKK